MTRHGPVRLHVRLSVLVAAAVILPLLLTWYPRPLFEAAGTARLPCFLAVLAAVTGPLVQSVMLRKGRPLTRSALRLVVIAQVVALAGCALALYVQRPVYLTFTVDRFDLVLARQIAPQDLAKATGQFTRRPLSGPVYAAAVQPSDPAEARRILDDAVSGGKDLQNYPQHYVPYSQQAAAALKRAKPLAVIMERDPELLKRYFESSGREAASLRYLPMRARKKDGVVLLDAVTGAPLQVLLIDPW